MAKAGLAQDNGLPLETRVSRLLAGRTLVMIGMMGAGKSSIGRRLANRLGMAFVDADSEIELAANATIPEIFETPRRSLFPRRRAPRHPAPARRQAQGAGHRRRRLHPAGHPRRDPGGRHLDLAERRSRPAAVARQAPQQPAAAQGRGPGAAIDRLIAERYPVYAEADIQVQSRDVAHDVVIDDILEALADFLSREAVAEA